MFRRKDVTMEIESEIKRIIINERSDGQVIVVGEKGKGSRRAFPIMVGIPEAWRLDCAIKDVKPPRPMTHDLIISTISGLGCAIEKLVISDLRDHIFIGTLVIKKPKSSFVKIDCRPSDGLILATLVKAPIYVEEKVFDMTAT